MFLPRYFDCISEIEEFVRALNSDWQRVNFYLSGLTLLSIGIIVFHWCRNYYYLFCQPSMKFCISLLPIKSHCVLNAWLRFSPETRSLYTSITRLINFHDQSWLRALSRDRQHLRMFCDEARQRQLSASTRQGRSLWLSAAGKQHFQENMLVNKATASFVVCLLSPPTVRCCTATVYCRLCSPHSGIVGKRVFGLSVSVCKPRSVSISRSESLHM